MSGLGDREEPGLHPPPGGSTPVTAKTRVWSPLFFVGGVTRELPVAVLVPPDPSWVSSGESGKLLGYLGAPGDGGAERVERAERSQQGGFVLRWSRSVQGPIWTSPGRTPLRAKPLPDVKWGEGGQKVPGPPKRWPSGDFFPQALLQPVDSCPVASPLSRDHLPVTVTTPAALLIGTQLTWAAPAGLACLRGAPVLAKSGPATL